MPAWAIVLCKYSDRDEEPISVDFCHKYFLGPKEGGLPGNLYHYWKEISYNKIILDGSEVLRPVNLSYTKAEGDAAAQAAKDLHPRISLVQKAADEVSAILDLSPFEGLILIHNEYGDAGMVWINLKLLDGTQRLMPVFNLHYMALDSKFQSAVVPEPEPWHGHGTMHESGHLLGLPHAELLNPPEAYGDAWDVMGGTRYDGPGPDPIFPGYRFEMSIVELNNPLCGPGLSAPSLQRLGCIEPSRQKQYSSNGRLMTVTLAALNHEEAEGALVAEVNLIDPKFVRLTVELRWKDGWDLGIPRNAFLLHLVDRDGVSYLVPASAKRHDWGPGDTYLTEDKRFQIKFLGINQLTYNGTIRIVPDLPYREIIRMDPQRLGPIPTLVFSIIWRIDHFVRMVFQTVRAWFAPRRPTSTTAILSCELAELTSAAKQNSDL